MSMTITFGWWIIPTVISIALFFAVTVWSEKECGGNDWLGVGVLFSIIGYLIAFLLSVVAWLIWAVLR